VKGKDEAMTAAALQSDATWLRTTDYHVAALNSKLMHRVAELKHALRAGLPAFADLNRRNFYDVELPGGWAYIHVRDDKQTVYLVAFHNA
jgi:hypothetical protein